MASFDIETGRASVGLVDGAQKFTPTAESDRHVLHALDGLARERFARRVSEPRYVGIRQINVGEQTFTVAEYEADFEVPTACWATDA